MAVMVGGGLESTRSLPRRGPQHAEPPGKAALALNLPGCRKRSAAPASPSSPPPQSTAARPDTCATPAATLPGIAELSRPAEATGLSPSQPLREPPVTSVMGTKTVQRRPMGLCVEEGHSPARLALQLVDHSARSRRQNLAETPSSLAWAFSRLSQCCVRRS